MNKSLDSRFVKNLRKAININDKYRYQRELFNGDSNIMNSTIDMLESFGTLDEAIDYLKKNFNWDTNTESTQDFYSLLENRFLNK